MDKISQIGIYISIIFLVISCNSTGPTKVVQPENDAVPELFEKQESSVSSFSKYNSRGDNLIENLFEEAREKDPHLDQLVKNIEEFDSYAYQQLIKMDQYSKNNEKYWKSVAYHISQIKDSVLQKQMQSSFNTLENQFQKQSQDIKHAQELLDQKTVAMKDQLVIMKLMVTQPMMYQYQKQEKPSVKVFDKVIYHLDSLVNQTKPYTLKKP
jgi:hypothetical protein